MKRVFILGSGFSSCGGAPISRAVIPTIFKEEQNDHMTVELKRYLSNFLFNGQDQWLNDADLEEILSRLDLIKIYRPYHNIDYDKVACFEEVLVEKFTVLLSPDKTKWNKPEYLAFRKFLKPSDSIITFNYDLIIEELLGSMGLTYDYNLDKDKNNVKKSGIEKIELIKLHGSINQFYCPKCTKVSIINYKDKDQKICQACHAKGEIIFLKQFIIAPTLFKTYSLPTLRHLWFKALSLLASADEIIFIGYSLPEADVLSYQLFDFSKKLSRKQQYVYLINGPRLNPRRFMDIYENSLINTSIYFQEWVSNGCTLVNSENKKMR